MYHARSRASVGCGGRLNGVSAARQHLRIAARRGYRASVQRAALEHGRVSNWRLRRVATQTCLATMMFQGVCSTREIEEDITLRLPGLGLGSWFSCRGLCKKTRQVIAKGKERKSRRANIGLSAPDWVSGQHRKTAAAIVHALPLLLGVHQ